MSIAFGKYHAVIYENRPVLDESLTDIQRESIDTRLTDLTNLLSDSPVEWYLVGGLGTALTHGEITRNHGDIDIQTFSEDAHSLATHMKQQDYILCQKILSTNISQSKRITVYAQISPLQPLTIDSQRLRFVKIHKGKILSNVEEPLLPYIDLFIAQRDYRGRTNLKYKKKFVCSTIPYTNPNLVVSFKGTKIKLRDPQAHSAIIRDSQSRKSIMNQKVLEQLLRKTNIN